jgi:hypothetical protein
LAKDWDNDVFLEAGYGAIPGQPSGEHSFFYAAVVTDGSESAAGQKDKAIDSGTLYISYDASQDELYLSDTGYGEANSWVTITGLLQNEWDAGFVFPYIGGWSDGVTLNSGDAYLDNFVVDSGSIMVIPAPGSITLGAIAVGLVGSLKRRRKI